MRSPAAFPGDEVIACQCNIITEREIEEAVVRLLDRDAWQLIVPAQVYHELGKRGRCCSCFPNTVEIIVATTEAYHRDHNHSPAEVVAFIARLRERQAQHEQARRASAARPRLRRAG